MTEEETRLKNVEVDEFLHEVEDAGVELGDSTDKDSKIKAIDDQLRNSLQFRISLPTVAGVILRYGAYKRMTAAIATAALVDIGLITEEDSSKVLDHHKVHREKLRYMKKLTVSAEEKYMNGNIKCILFDGRKNWTNVMEKDLKSGRYYQRYYQSKNGAHCSD